MIPYWLLWAFFFFGLMFTARRATASGPTSMDVPGLSLGTTIGLLGAALMIGLRHKVGGDWGAYERMYEWTAQASLGAVLAKSDPGYFFLNWLVQQLGIGLWLVNTVCGVITILGVALLVRREPQPWLAVLVAIPYLVIVVAMGYTRQAAALGFVMIGLASLLRNGSVLRYALWITLAALFHKTAVICLPLVAFTGERRKFIDPLLIASASIGLYTLLLQDSFDNLVDAYIGTRYNSAGATIRISMSFLPAVVLLLFRSRLGFTPTESKLWRNFSIVSLLAAAGLVLSPSSTAVDRIALYLLPLQFIVLPRIPGALVARGFGNFLIAAYSAAVLFIWLNYAVHARFWVPYDWWLSQ